MAGAKRFRYQASDSVISSKHVTTKKWRNHGNKDRLNIHIDNLIVYGGNAYKSHILITLNRENFNFLLICDKNDRMKVL